MIYLALIMTFLAVILAFYLIYIPLKENIHRSSRESRDRINKELEEMFIFLPFENFFMVKLGLGAGVGMLGFILFSTGTAMAPFISAGLGALLGFYLPELFIAFLRRRRRKQFSEQFIDGLVMLSNGLRAGFTLQQAMELLVDEMPAPLSQEFELILREYRLGVEIDQALQNAVTRTKDEDLDLAVSAIVITRRMGGNLAEIFERIVNMVRDRKLLGGKAAALTAQGKIQALVVGALPYGFGFILFQINPDMLRLMWTTIPGFIGLVIVVILDLIGYLWVKKIADVKY
ncbi:MAG: type II secretion system F family protein [Verrucomicrobia bacterium]|nr:type II secretion system F family protein [Kiritimatiellia bacterium]MCP5488469.1 type II secretion system F family protein [Verrucomicrobiota bacterium]